MSSIDQYIAVGFSSDKKMGDDSVTECVMTNGNTFSVVNSFNVDDDDNEMTTAPATGLSAISGTYTNGILDCSFQRANTTADPQITSLLTDWYLFWAIGRMKHSEKHEHEDWGISSKVVDLQTYEDVGELGKPKVKAHGCLTIIAWVGFCSIGVVLARYYKPMWISKKLFGAAIWIQVHRALMIAAALFNLIAVIVIFEGEFEIYGSSFQNAHPVLGMIVTVVSVLNCIGGFLRPGPKHKFRPYFNWAHLIMGLLSYILGVFTIGIGLSIDDAHVPFDVIYVLVAFVVYQISFEVILEFIDRTGKRKQSEAGSYDTKMNSIGGSKTNVDENEKKAQESEKKEQDQYCGKLKTYLLFLHIGIITAFTLSIMSVLAAY
ncbi:putative ferric-chelate reductase 1 homolog isoform X2 [Mytilus trossulus]